MVEIKATREAFGIMTNEQREAIVYLADNPSGLLDRVVVQAGSFGLPDGYLSFAQHWTDGRQPIIGGIAPDGAVST